MFPDLRPDKISLNWFFSPIPVLFYFHLNISRRTWTVKFKNPYSLHTIEIWQISQHTTLFIKKKMFIFILQIWRILKPTKIKHLVSMTMKDRDLQICWQKDFSTRLENCTQMPETAGHFGPIWWMQGLKMLDGKLCLVLHKKLFFLCIFLLVHVVCGKCTQMCGINPVNPKLPL